MKKEVLEQIKNDLQTRKKEVEEELSKIANKDSKNNTTAIFPDYGDKPDESAMEIDDYSTNLATEKILADTLRDINGALSRIEKGTYGICKYCSKEIDEKRLLARPVASACVQCNEKLQNAF